MEDPVEQKAHAGQSQKQTGKDISEFVLDDLQEQVFLHRFQLAPEKYDQAGHDKEDQRKGKRCEPPEFVARPHFKSSLTLDTISRLEKGLVM